MAVTGGTEEVKTVLTIDTSKSASSMKELRTQIKELKDQLVGLDQGTQEYSDTLVQLGEKMHQMKEINEEIRRTNSDFGDTLSNISNVMAGGVGAVQGLTAGLSLLGVEMGDDNKLTQTLVKSMALLQSLGTMDKAVKSFRALTNVMKASITTAGGLGKALKALAVSNPFTAILAAATALIAVGVKLISMFNEAAQAAEALKDAAMFDANAQAMKEMGWQLEEMTRRMKLEGKNQYEIMEAQQKQLLKNIQDLENRSIQLYKRLEEASGDRADQIQAEIDKLNQLKQTYMDQREYNTRMRSILWDEEQKRQKDEEAKKKKARQNAAKQAAADAKARLDAQYKAEQDNYNHLLSLQKQAYQEQLEQAERVYQNQLELADGNAEAIEAAERQKASAVFRIEQDNYLKLIELAENYRKLVEARPNKDGSQTAQLDQLNETIQNLTISLNGCSDAYRQLVREQTAADAETAYNKANFEARKKMLEDDIALTQAHNERYLELIKQKYVMQADIEAEAIRYQQEQLTQDNSNIDVELDLLKQQLDAKLILQEEYDQQVLELEQRRMENTAALNELEVEAEKNKMEKKKELQEMYMSAISSISGSITAVLNEAANAEDVSFEDQKKLKIASTIITTLTSAMEAFQSVASIPIVGPALGAAAAASTIAVGMMQVNKIRQTKKNSSNASASTGAIQTIQTPTQMTNITGFSDNVELPDQRVYVVYDDIADAGNRVQVVENNSSF